MGTTDNIDIEKKWNPILKTIAGLLVVVIPALFSYCQASEELRLKYNSTDKKAKAGYQELMESVVQLQKVVKQQHEDIDKLTEYSSFLEKKVAESRAPEVKKPKVRTTPPTVLDRPEPAPAPPLPAPPEPALTAPAANLQQAVQEQRIP